MKLLGIQPSVQKVFSCISAHGHFLCCDSHRRLTAGTATTNNFVIAPTTSSSWHRPPPMTTALSPGPCAGVGGHLNLDKTIPWRMGPPEWQDKCLLSMLDRRCGVRPCPSTRHSSTTLPPGLSIHCPSLFSSTLSLPLSSPFSLPVFCCIRCDVFHQSRSSSSSSQAQHWVSTRQRLWTNSVRLCVRYWMSELRAFPPRISHSLKWRELGWNPFSCFSS